MKKRLFLLVFLTFITVLPSFSQRIVGYLPSYRDPNGAQIRWSCLTDVCFSFINFNTSGNLILTNIDATFGFDMGRFTTTKGYCKPISATGPKLWISVGGADSPGLRKARFTAVCSNGTTRTTLVNELVAFAVTHNLEGIDIDWEFPSNNATDRGYHQSLMQELRARINLVAPSVKLSMAVGGEYSTVLGNPTHLDYCNDATMAACDFINVMTYDLPVAYGVAHSPVGHSQSAVSAWKNRGSGTPWSKMLIGIPFYSKHESSRVDRDYNAEAAYTTAYTSGVTGTSPNRYYGNSATEMQQKVDWIMAQGGSGVLIWDIGQDRTNAGYNYQDVICARMATACAAPQPNLGADQGICLPGSVVLNSGVATQAGRTFAWLRNGTTISGATSPTYTATLNGTYRVTVTQSSCSRFDEVDVVTSSPVTANGGSRCGTGTVTLNATSAGGPFQWYDLSVGGTLLGTTTGSANFTTPSISATTTYYVQEATGSTTNYSGKLSMNVPNAQPEFSSDANPGTKPQHAHKFTALQQLTIETVTIYTTGVARTGAQIIVYDASNNNLVAQSAAVNIPTMAAGTPFAINCALAVSPGTYFIGIFVPNTNSGNATVWQEANYSGTTNFVVPGVISIEPKSYSGNFPLASPNLHYGQLFNWVITTGVVNPCPRTAVVATIGTGPAAPTGFTGSLTPCAGSTGNVYSVTNVASTTYAWVYSGTGATITAGAGTNSITVSYSAGATAGTWSVTPTLSGCTGTAFVSGSTTISALPAQPSTITAGTATPCPTSTGNTYTVTNVAGVTYTWTYSGTGQTVTAGAGSNAITVSYASGTAGIWTVTPSNACGNGTTRTLAVTLGAIPAQPSTITAGTATPCPTSTGNTYTVTNVAGVTYTWTYSGTGQTVTAGAGTNAITVSYASGTAGIWTVTPSNACGNGTAQTLAVTMGAIPAQPSTITAGTATPCPTSTGNTYTVTNVAGVTYTWTYSGTGQTVTAGAGTNAITVSYASGTAGIWTVTPSNACGNGTTRTLAVTLGALPAQPSTITAGTATPCPTSTGNTYTVTNVAGVTYTWTYSGTGQTVTAGAGTNAITVSYASGTAGIWTVTPSNACGNGTTRTLAVTMGAIPAQPSTITAGTATPCPTSTGNTYTVTNVAGVTYTWTYSGTGQTVTAGAGTNAITVSYASGTAGIWTVTPSNACGNGTTRTLAVTMGAIPAQPSTITAGTATPCPTSTGNTYTVTNVAGVTYTWTYSGTGQTVTAGAGTNAITVSYASGTAGIWTVTPSNACGNGTAQTLAVTMGAIPAQPSTITAGTATPCPTSTGNTYTVTNVAGVTYTWTYSGTGQTVTAGAGTNAITVSYASGTAGIWTVTPSNACGNGTTRTLAVTLGALPAQPSTITAGTATPCPTSTGNTYTVTNVAGVTYTWTYSGTGQTVTAGAGTNAITVSYASGTAGIWTVTPSNACGNGTAQTLAVTMGAIPAQPSTITAGTATPCPTSTGNTYTVTNVAGVTYTWTYSGTGQTVTAGAGTNAITVSYASGTAGIWTVTPSNACGNGTTRTLAVTMGAAPATPSAITGTTTLTQSTTGNAFSVTNVAGVTYAWTYSGTGGTINSGTTNAITLDLSGTATSGTLSVTATNACGTSTASTVAITVNPATVPQPGAFTTSSATVCQGATGVVYTVPNVGGTTYNWTYSGTGFTITAGAGTNSITASFSGAATSGTLSVVAQVGASLSTPRTMAVTVNAIPAQPSTITAGTATPCPTSTGNTYTVTNVAGVTYTWTYSGTGQTVTAGAGTNAITVSYASGTAGIWTVTPSNACGNGTTRTLAVTLGALPAQPSTITAGTATPCPTSTGNTYTVTNVAGVTYTWTYSGTGQTVTAGAGTNAITVSYASGTAGIWTVTPSNACGNGTAQTLAVTMGAIPAQPSTITAGTATPCPTSTGNTYTVTNVAGVTYTWTYSGTGQTVTAGAGTNAITVSYASGTAGIWTVTPSNACGNGTTRTLAVTMGAAPATPSAITGTTTLTQSTTGNAFSVTNVAGVTYAWTYSGTGGTINSGTTNAITLDLSGTATSGTLSVTATNACGTSTASTVAITVNPATVPQPGAFTTSSATVCQGATGVVYTVPNVGGTTYNWTYSGTGFTITAGAGTNSITASFSGAATSGTLSVVAQVGASLSTPRTMAVTVNAIPAQPSTITAGTATPCPTSTGNTYTVTNVAGVTYTWTYSGTGQTVTAGAGTNAITVSYASGTAGIWTVTPSNACGNGTTRTLAVTMGAAPATPSAITGTTTLTQSTTGNAFSVTNVAGVTYAWTYSGTGGTINSGTTNAITLDLSGTATSGTLSVTATNACGTSTASTVAITVNPATVPQPGAFTTSSATVCQGATGVVYTVPNVGGTTYNWTYSGTGFTITAGAGTSSITASFSGAATSGTLSVVAQVGASLSTPRTMAVTVNAAPAAPSAITGTTTLTQGTTGNAFSVTNVSGITYAWTYSGTGGTINSGTTNAITLDLSGSATSGTLSVTATNGCGTSTASTTAVTVNGSGTPQPGGFTTSSATVCQGQQGVAYTVPNVVGTTYTWTYSGTDVIINGNTNTITIDFGMTATSGTLSVVANNGSGASTPRTMAITVSAVATQPAVITGPSTVSGGQTNLVYFVANQSGVTFNWTYTGANSSITTGQGTNIITIDFANAATSGNLKVTATGVTCGASAATSLAITVLPPLGVDDAEGVSYDLKVYPNPAASYATVEMNLKNGGMVDLGVYDMLGTEVKVLLNNEMLTSDTYTFSIDDLAYGVYLVKAKSGNETKVVKLIKH